jgi:hypothetical protein
MLKAIVFKPTIEEVDIDPMGGMWADMNLDQFR